MENNIFLLQQQQQQQQQQQSMMLAPHVQQYSHQSQMLAMMNPYMDYYNSMNYAMVDSYGLHAQQPYNPYGQMVVQSYTDQFKAFNSSLVASAGLPVAAAAQVQHGHQGAGPALMEMEAVQTQPIANAVVSGSMIACGWRGCDAIFTDKPAFDEHVAQAHSGGKPFSCSWKGCRWQFSSVDELLSHIAVHENDNRLAAAAAASASLNKNINYTNASHQTSSGVEGGSSERPPSAEMAAAAAAAAAAATPNLALEVAPHSAVPTADIQTRNLTAHSDNHAPSHINSHATDFNTATTTATSGHAVEKMLGELSRGKKRKKASTRTPPNNWFSDGEEGDAEKPDNVYGSEQHEESFARKLKAYKKNDGGAASRKLKLPSMSSPSSYKGGGMQKKTLAQATVQTPEKKYCLCKAVEDGKCMVQCDTCSDWYHPNCVGMTKKEARWVTKFVCPICLSKEMTQPAVTGRSAARSSPSSSAFEMDDPEKRRAEPPPLQNGNASPAPSPSLERMPRRERSLKPFGFARGSGVPYMKGRHPRTAVPVEQCSMETGESIQIYKSMSQAARAVGVTYTGGINAACSSGLAEAHGFVWRFPSADDVAAWRSANKEESASSLSTKRELAPAGGESAAPDASESGTTAMQGGNSFAFYKQQQQQQREHGSKGVVAKAGSGAASRQLDDHAEDFPQELDGAPGHPGESSSFASSQHQVGSEKGRAHGKSVEQLCLETGRVLAEYCSQREAARACDGRQSAISMVCRGVKLSVHGFFWRFKGSTAIPQGISSHSDGGGAGAAGAGGGEYTANAASSGDSASSTTVHRKGKAGSLSKASRPSASSFGERAKNMSGGNALPSVPAVRSSEPKGDCPAYRRELVRMKENSDRDTASSARPRAMPIQQLCMATGNVLNRFKSQFDAARHLNIGYSASILATCVGKQNSAHGFFWRFSDSKLWPRMQGAKQKKANRMGARRPVVQRREAEADCSHDATNAKKRGDEESSDEFSLSNAFRPRSNEELDEVDEMEFFSSKTDQ